MMCGRILIVLTGLGLIGLFFIGKTGAQQRSAPVADEADQPIRTTVQNPDAVAVVIGIAQYEDRDDIPSAANAVNDADAVGKVLAETLGYAPKNIIDLRNEQASVGRIKRAIRQQLAGLVQPGKSDVFFYY